MSYLLSEKKLFSLLNTLSGDFVFLESTRISEENHRSFLFNEPLEILTCTQDEDPERFLQQASEKLSRGYYLAGWIGYEFGHMLEPVLACRLEKTAELVAQLGVFEKPYVFDHLTGTFGDTGVWPEIERSEYPGSFEVKNLALNMERDEYCRVIQTIKRYIESGDTYQVNFTLKLFFELCGGTIPFYQALRSSQHVGYGAFMRFADSEILSFSPELFFRKSNDLITVRPMKGTIRRGRTLAEDRELCSFLKHDIKNRSENVMIVDLLRNDIGRLCKDGQVKVKSLFDVETFETLHQLTSTVQGRLKPGCNLVDIFRALFPCGSVTGAPKIRTMEIIRELEKEARGVYTGAIGYITPDGEAAFNVPIRTVVVRSGKGEMGIGSGIVYDSEPQKEWEECLLKGEFLTSPRPECKLIETMLWTQTDGFWLLDLHLDRLMESARYFNFPVCRDGVAGLLHKETERWKQEQAPGKRVRLTLACDGRIEIEAATIAKPELQVVFDRASVIPNTALPKVLLSEEKTDSTSPYLYHKTTHRQLYDRARERAVEQGFLDVLFCNEKGEVTEGAISNIFIRKGNKIFTPPVECGLLPGVFRRWVIEANPEVREKVFFPQEIMDADAVYIGNSVRGLVEVRIG
jgi:para-aminobenzoate synthetase/4-amino-4-deoxychorismate lyase